MKSRIIPSRWALPLAIFVSLCLPCSSFAAERITLTMIAASNEGEGFDLDNDAYRDQMIRLFSYKAYRQIDQQAFQLEPDTSKKFLLPEDYTLNLTWQGVEGGRHLIHALIVKSEITYVDTVLSILQPGVVFLGGPPLDEGALIIVLEMGF